MFKNNRTFYFAIAAGVATLAFYIGVINLAPLFYRGWRFSGILKPFVLIFVSLALLGITKAMLNHRLFWALSMLALVIAVFISIFLLSSVMGWYWWFIDKISLLFDNLFGSSDRALSNILYSHNIIVAIFGIGLLMKRKWQLAVCMLTISLPNLFARYVIQIDPQLWLLEIFGIIESFAWFVIAWWLKKENAMTEPLGFVEAT